MAYDKQNVIHCLAFLSLSVAVQGDEVGKGQRGAMAAKLTEWLRIMDWDVNEDGVIDNDDAIDIFLNEVTPFLGNLNPDELIAEVYQTCAFINSLALEDRWSDNLSKQVVQDIVEVAIADDKVLQSEINLIKAIATTLGIIEDEALVKVLDYLNTNVVNP